MARSAGRGFRRRADRHGLVLRRPAAGRRLRTRRRLAADRRRGPAGAGESDTDGEGNARSLDGDGNCDARPDIGAFEAPAAACVPPASQPDVQPQPPATDATAPVVTKVRLFHRRSVRFTVSEAARVTIRITRSHRKPVVLKRTVAAGQVSLKLKRALGYGRYAIRVLAVDAAGNRSAPAIVRRRV